MLLSRASFSQWPLIFSSSFVNQVGFILPFHFFDPPFDVSFLLKSPNREAMERIMPNINALGVNRPTQPFRKEQGLHLLIANDERKLEVLEARRAALPQELDHISEEIAQVGTELNKVKSLLES